MNKKSLNTELVQNDLNLKSFFKLSSSMICIAGFDGYFKQVNPAWEKILGYSMDQFLKAPYIDFVHPEDVEPTLNEAKKLILKKTETVSFTNRYRHINGTYKWFQWNVNSNQEEQLFYCVANDISFLKKIEKDLKVSTHNLGERNKELRCLYSISINILSQKKSLNEICDQILKQISISWQYPSITCARIILNDREFQTDNFTETVWKQTSDIWDNDNKIGVLEVYYLKLMPEIDEGPFLKEERDLINAITKMISDYCIQKKILNSLHESREQYRILTEQSADGVLVTKKDKILFANTSLEKILSYRNHNTIIGKNFSALFTNEFKKPFKIMCDMLTNNQERQTLFQGIINAYNGRQLWIEGNFSNLIWEGEPAIHASIRDVDSSKHHEVSLQKEADSLRREYMELKSTIKERYKFGNIIGKSDVMQKVYEQILNAASSDSSVVIYGETGTGKEEVARTIHKISSRHTNSFVPVNCGAIPESLFESEFFGYKKGAFTGAFIDKHGYFDLAHRGSLFLDEVAELNINMQVKLLRALESGEFTAIGDGQTKSSDSRIISATNVDMMSHVRNRRIREDFYYRIHVIPINLPPLRERKDDIILIAEHFLQKFCDNKKLQFTGKEMELLCEYSWPGNIRELQNVVQRYVMAENLNFLDIRSLEKELDLNISEDTSEGLKFREAMVAYEKRIIINALEKYHWHKEKTASYLGLPKRTFFRKLQKLGLQ